MKTSPNELYTRTRARKAHACWVCDDPIPKGEHYWRSRMHWLTWQPENLKRLLDDWHDLNEDGPTDWFPFAKICQPCADRFPIFLDRDAEAETCTGSLLFFDEKRRTARIPHVLWCDRWTFWVSWIEQQPVPSPEDRARRHEELRRERQEHEELAATKFAPVYPIGSEPDRLPLGMLLRRV